MKKQRTETEKLVELMQRASEARDSLKMLTTADEILRREPANVDAMFVAGTAFLHELVRDANEAVSAHTVYGAFEHERPLPPKRAQAPEGLDHGRRGANAAHPAIVASAVRQSTAEGGLPALS